MSRAPRSAREALAARLRREPGPASREVLADALPTLPGWAARLAHQALQQRATRKKSAAPAGLGGPAIHHHAD